MKIKSLFLLGLSAVALASCGGVKEPNAYKNEVKKDAFLAKFEENTKDNLLLHANEEGKDPFSFVVEGEGSGESIYVDLKDGKEYNKRVSKSNSESSTKFDLANKICQTVSETKSSSTADGRESEATEKSDDTNKLEAGYAYEIDNVAKTFEKYKVEVEVKDKDIFSECYSDVSKMISRVKSLAAGADEEHTKFYIDNNIYTFVIEEKENDEESKSSSVDTTLYQLVVNADSIEYFYKSDSSYSDKDERSEYHTLQHSKVSKKDVSLKSPDLSKYLDLSEEAK